MNGKTETVSRRLWDVVVVGSGIGGGTAAYGFARSGKSVLLIERGRSYAASAKVVLNDLEKFRRGTGRYEEKSDRLKNAGVFWDVVDDVTRTKAVPFKPYIGSGVGGGSSLFAMAMERFRPEDFSPGKFFADVPEANVPAEWPITYADLAYYYKEAERLYRVRGTPDPLGPADSSYGYLTPPPLSQSNTDVMLVLMGNGLHPYYHPMACEYREGCRECLGFICPVACKNDSFRRCIEPAIREFGAELLDECEVVYVDADRSRVTAVHCIYRGIPLILRAKTVVLSAGALQTPALLLKSASASWPYGIGNRYDQVGRNFMRHLIDLHFVRPQSVVSPSEMTKQISFNDFYVNEGVKLGNVQSLGRLQSLDLAVEDFEGGLTHRWPCVAPAIRLVRPIMKRIARKALSGTLIFAGILEDLPYPENRVTYNRTSSRIRVCYRIHGEARRRLRQFRVLCQKAFHPLPVKLVRAAYDSRLIAHQVGTCRFGTSPENSVLDPNCRVHELDNLFVLDGSFMPTSGGINPSLTIAANALRVVNEIGQ